MAKFIRYALAAIFFAASVGCLALWWRSQSNVVDVIFPLPAWPARMCAVEAHRGLATIYTTSGMFGPRILSSPIDPTMIADFRNAYLAKHGVFGQTHLGYCFPLWYPALISAIAGVGVLRVRRQFSIRSALVGLTVVAALLGMAVAL